MKPGVRTSPLVVRPARSECHRTGRKQALGGTLLLFFVWAASGQAGTPPAIVTAPSGRVQLAGKSHVLSVAAVGDGPLAYQWRFNGADILGGTDSSLSLTNLQLAHSGAYSVEIRNSYGSITSAPTRLAVYSSGTVYAWGDNNHGQTNVPVGLTRVVAIWAGVMTCAAVSIDGTVAGWGGEGNFFGLPGTSLGGVVTTVDYRPWNILYDILYTTDASGQLYIAGQRAPATGQVVKAAGDIDHALALRADGTVVGFGYNDIFGASQVPPGVTGVVDIAVAGGISCALKNTGEIVKWGAGGGGSWNVGDVTRIETTGTWLFALRRDGSVVRIEMPSGYPEPEVVSTNLVDIAAKVGYLGLLPDGTLADRSGSFSEVMAISCGVGGYNGVYLALVGSDPVGPVIAVQPTLAPNNGLLYVATAGIPPLSYQWRLNGANLPGQTDVALPLTQLQAGVTDYCSIVVSNVYGAVTSSVTPVFIPGTPPQILLQPQDATAVEGTAAAFDVILAGTPPLAYQWFFNGGALRGATNSSLALPYAQLAQAGSYHVVVTNWGGAVTSAVATLTVRLALTLTSPGGGQATPDPSLTNYSPGSVVTLNAGPAPGWSFLQWLGDASGTGATTSVTMSRNRLIEAWFGTTLTGSNTQGGTVDLEPKGALYPYGALVQATAVSASGYAFANWHGSSLTTNPLQYTVTAPNTVLAADFQPLAAGRCALTVLARGLGTVSVNPASNSYALGTEVTLTAIPGLGQFFLGWAGDAGGTQNPLSLTLTQSSVVQARFTSRGQLILPVYLTDPSEAGFGFRLLGQLGAHYEIQTSVDCTTWSRFTDLTNDFGTIPFKDGQATNRPIQFYRAMELP